MKFLSVVLIIIGSLWAMLNIGSAMMLPRGFDSPSAGGMLLNFFLGVAISVWGIFLVVKSFRK